MLDRVRTIVRRLPRGALGMLALVVAVETGLDRRAGEFRDLIAWNNAFARQAARSEAPRARILCLGDSMMKLGVLPAVLERRLGLPAYNLGVIGAEPSMTYFLLREALERGSRPEAILVDFAPNLARSNPLLFVDEKSEGLGPRDVVDLALASRSFNYAARLVLARSLPSIRYRHPLRARIAADLKAEAGPFADRGLFGRQLLRNWSVNLGANAAVGLIGASDGQDAPYLDPPWSVHPLSWDHIDRVFRLAESRQIPVFWLIPPFVDETQHRREALGVDAAFDRFVDQMQARHPSITVLDSRRLGLDRSHFSDPGHLNASGAAVQSLALADALARSLSDGPRAPMRILLKALPAPSDPPPLEDFAASCRVIAASASSSTRR